MNIFEEIKIDLDSSWTSYTDTMLLTLKSDIGLLNQINTYLLEHSGKKVRPIFTLLLAGATGGINENAIKSATVVEMIHTATLLHDDVADDSDYRRGVKTIKFLFSAASSVLTGDYWLAKAFELLTSIDTKGVLASFTHSVHQLAEGEMFQMEKASLMDTTEEDYFKIIEKKTSSLFIASATSAAMTNNSSAEVVSSMEVFAYNMGLAFQIQDDIFDYSPDLKTGKTSGTDIRERKITLPLIGALKNSQKSESESILAMFLKETNDDILIENITNFVIKNGGIEYAKSSLNSHIDDAIIALEILPKTLYRSRLEQIARYFAIREN